MLPTQSSGPRDDDRTVVYRGCSYRRLADGVLVAPPAGRFQTLSAAAVPHPVLRALGLAARAGVWRPAG
jgi:hypothetical protein